MSRRKEMVMKKCIFLGVMTLMCCTHKQVTPQLESNRDSIVVAYYPYTFETTVRVSCRSMALEAAKVPVDTIISLHKEDFDKIKGFVENQVPTDESHGCDARIYIKSGASEVCLGSVLSCLCDINDNNIEGAMDAIYLIKWKSGFFNCFDREELNYDETIKEYF